MSEVSKNIFFSCVLVFFVCFDHGPTNHFFPSPTPVSPLFSSSSTAPPSSSPPPQQQQQEEDKEEDKEKEKKQQEEEEEDKQEEDKHKHKEMFDRVSRKRFDLRGQLQDKAGLSWK